MDRKEIKELAKKKIKGNIWNILWPLLVIGVLQSIISSLIGANISYSNITSLEELGSITVPSSTVVKSTLLNILVGVVSGGYTKYILDFVRNGKFDTNTIIETIKEKWLNLLIAETLVSIIVAVGFALFVIPGIILTLAYAFVTYLVIDTDVSGSDSLKKSREMMKGYKWDFLVFCLSFLGWIILGVLTLGILFIWVVPYMMIAGTLYYEKLKELK
ncbi:MAG: DUF975 family protein [Bacilli bacterium]|nr:DUF975 family protein [Bacilli bacterium]